MVIDNVGSDVNGTSVECSYPDGRVVSTDIINVIGNGIIFDLIIYSTINYSIMSWNCLHRYDPSHTSY
jgi:hypothetical protein